MRVVEERKITRVARDKIERFDINKCWTVIWQSILNDNICFLEWAMICSLSPENKSNRKKYSHFHRLSSEDFAHFYLNLYRVYQGKCYFFGVWPHIRAHNLYSSIAENKRKRKTYTLRSNWKPITLFLNKLFL